MAKLRHDSIGLQTMAKRAKKLTANERMSPERELDYCAREVKALHARMQTRKARQAVDDLFCATDIKLNRRPNR